MKTLPSNPLDALIDAAVERAIERLVPHLANPRPTWTTPKNARDVFAGKTWRAIDESARRRKVPRFNARVPPRIAPPISTPP